MYIHMFAFRFKNGVTSEQKNHCVSEIRKLKDDIKEVQEAWVGLNVSPRGQGYELGGSMKFADVASFELLPLWRRPCSSAQGKQWQIPTRLRSVVTQPWRCGG